METVYYLLKDVAENEMTHFILSKFKHEGTDRVYFDDFLGEDDVTDENKPLVRSEDRIFTTAMAANALICTWAVYDDDARTTHWKEGVSEDVKGTITGCISWLTAYALDRSYEPWNAVFSFTVKDLSHIPFWYPANFFEGLNGTEISDWSVMPDTMASYGIKGYIPKDEYDAMLEERRSLYPIPSTFQGYTSPTANFIFWSSDAFTYASTLLAVSRYRNIVG
ncbi:unnamed protein product [Lymnaea stagnalis]|uniref:Uncharacterized protein n=1 Tax=Lymnaea stagnalis TaxID=6523 RepID=A0AAV2IJA2_LYMST